MRLYLAGPMTGHDNYNFPEFFRVAKALRALGNEVVSPAEEDLKQGWVKAEVVLNGAWTWCYMSPSHERWDGEKLCAGIGQFPHRFTITPEFDYEKALELDIDLIRSVSAVVLLPGWEGSGGARREAQAAIDNGKTLYEWVENDPAYPSKLRYLPWGYVNTVLAQQVVTPADEAKASQEYKSATDEPMPHEVKRNTGIGCGWSENEPLPGPRPGKTVYTEPRQLRSPEVHEAIGVFTDLLLATLGDGSDKRMRGEKPSWKVDEHMSHVYSHLGKYAKGEVIDPDSGVHTLAHAACRLLFVAASETAAMGNMRPAPPDATLDYPGA